MPIAFEGPRAVFSGICGAESAEPLLAWLLEEKNPTVDLAGCRHLHGAVLQVLLAARPEISGTPEDPFLREQVLPLLGRGQ